MKSLILLLAFAASAYAIIDCLPTHFQREYVYAKGHAKVTRPGQPDVRKKLRIDLVTSDYALDGSTRAIVVSTVTTDDTGFYVIAGSGRLGCLQRHKDFHLEVYDEQLARYRLNSSQIPAEYEFLDGQPVKIFEKDIVAEYMPPPS